MKTVDLIRKGLPFLILLAPIIVFFTVVMTFSVNIPYNDDYETVLGFLNDYVASTGPAERINLVFQPWNEHRIVFSKIVTVAIYRIAGSVDFRTMILIGNFGLLLIIGALFYVFSRKHKDRLILFLPAVLLFFQPSYNENIFFGMASLANFYVLGFGFLSIVILSPENKMPRAVTLSLSIFFAVMSYWTQANGILYLLTGLLLLLHQKRFRESVAWAVISAASVLLYSLTGTAGGSGLTLPGSPQAVLNMALYFFTFIGNNFGISAGGYFASEGPAVIKMFSRVAPVAAGLLVSAYFILLTVKRYDRKNPVVYSLFVLLFLTAAGAAYSRGSSYGVAQALTSRYRVVTILFYILTYLSLLDIIVRKPLKRIAWTVSFGLAFAFNIALYVMKWKPIQIHRQNLITSMENWKSGGRGIDPLAHPSGYANRILSTSVHMKIYKVPEHY